MRKVQNDPLKLIDKQPIAPNCPDANWRPLIAMVLVQALRDARKDSSVMEWLEENGELFAEGVGYHIHKDLILDAAQRKFDMRLRGLLRRESRNLVEVV